MNYLNIYNIPKMPANFFIYIYFFMKGKSVFIQGQVNCNVSAEQYSVFSFDLSHIHKKKKALVSRKA